MLYLMYISDIIVFCLVLYNLEMCCLLRKFCKYLVWFLFCLVFENIIKIIK